MTSYLLTICLSRKEEEATKRFTEHTFILAQKERKGVSWVCPSHLVQPKLIFVGESLCD